jgi:hypothetical protein
MKSFLTTLDLVMQDKVDPETLVEEDQIEETLTINEDGEIVDENWLTDKLKSAGTAIKGKYDSATKKKEQDPTHWSNAGKKAALKAKAKQLIVIPDDDDEEHTSTLLGGKYDESVEQIEKFVLECERLHEMKRLSGQVITEAPMTKEHYIAVADIIGSIESTTVRKAIMDKFADALESKYPNFQKEIFVNYIRSVAGKIDVGSDSEEDPSQLPPGESETETDGMINIPGIGVKVVSKDSEEYKKAEAGADGYSLAEGAVNEIWAPSKEIDDMEFPTKGVTDGWKKRDSEELVSSDWGSSDWTVAMETMWDSLLKQHAGKVTPETMEAAAEEVIMMHGEQMGYDEGSFDEGVSQVVSMFLNRQDGIKDSNMIGLANDTHRYAGKTKYMA